MGAFGGGEDGELVAEMGDERSGEGVAVVGAAEGEDPDGTDVGGGDVVGC